MISPESLRIRSCNANAQPAPLALSSGGGMDSAFGYVKFSVLCSLFSWRSWRSYASLEGRLGGNNFYKSNRTAIE